MSPRSPTAKPLSSPQPHRPSLAPQLQRDFQTSLNRTVKSGIGGRCCLPYRLGARNGLGGGQQTAPPVCCSAVPAPAGGPVASGRRELDLFDVVALAWAERGFIAIVFAVIFTLGVAGAMLTLKTSYTAESRFLVLLNEDPTPAAAGWGELETLSASRNGLVVLPATTGAWAKLARLDLHANKLVQLDGEATFAAWPALAVCNLSKNQIAMLPSTIGQCAALTAL